MEKPGEKSLFPQLGQIGVVVRDLDRTVKYYSEILGLGPFRFAFDRSIPETTYRGEHRPLRLKQAWTQLGPVELELIEVLSGESTHTEFLRDKGEGLHHLGFFVPDLDNALAKAEKLGIGVIQSGKIEGGGFAYLDTEKNGGVIFEFVQRKNFWTQKK